MTNGPTDSTQPFYRRWWFMVVAALVGLVLLAVLLTDSDTDGVLLGLDTTTSTEALTTTGARETTTTRAAPTTTAGTSTSTAPGSATTTASFTTTSSVPGLEEALVVDLLASIPVELETQDGYNRDLFDVWSDLDGDGCDTREEVLIRDAVETRVVGSGCDVGSGLWYSPYDDVWLDAARQLQVDHVVALKEAWDSGARDWDDDRRVAFGNDMTSPLTLIAVSSSSNQDKGDADPSNWLPTNQDDLCRFVAAWVVIKSTWDLSMDESEHGRISNLLDDECQGATIADAEVVRPAPPTTATTVPTSTSTVAGSIAVIIADIRYDGPGNDVEFGDSEYVLLHNNGTGTADVGGWSLEDEASHVITIPSGYVIQAGGDLRVYSGPGNDTATAFFAGLGQAVWNNDGGDTATLRDAGGQTVDSYSYSS